MPLAVAVLALYYAVIAVALASLTDRRIVGGLAFLGALFIPSIVAGVLSETVGPDGSTLANAFNLLQLPLIVRDLVFEGRVDIDNDLNLAGAAGAGIVVVVVYAVIVGVSLAVLHRRYLEAKP